MDALVVDHVDTKLETMDAFGLAVAWYRLSAAKMAVQRVDGLDGPTYTAVDALQSRVWDRLYLITDHFERGQVLDHAHRYVRPARDDITAGV